jgi:hypothetical protein
MQGVVQNVTYIGPGYNLHMGSPPSSYAVGANVSGFVPPCLMAYWTGKFGLQFKPRGQFDCPLPTPCSNPSRAMAMYPNWYEEWVKLICNVIQIPSNTIYVSCGNVHTLAIWSSHKYQHMYIPDSCKAPSLPRHQCNTQINYTLHVCPHMSTHMSKRPL